MKEGVQDECADPNDYGAFGGNWGDLDDDYDNADTDYGDYVQPTKKPLIFKEFFNNKPLSSRRKYEARSKKKDTSYNQIPDLPPPAAFPDLFSAMPGGGGFMNSNNKPKLSVKRPPSSYAPPRTTNRDREPERKYQHKKNFEVKNSGSSGMYREPEDLGYPATSRPGSFTTSQQQTYNAPTSPRYNSPQPVYTSPKPVYTSPKPIYTTQRQAYDYHTTARPVFTSARQSYDYHTTARPKYTSPRSSYDYQTTLRPKFTTPRMSYDYHTSARPSFSSAMPDYKSSPSPRIHRKKPRIPSDSPYKFYTPKPIEEDGQPAPLPPPGNFPTFYNNGAKREKEEVVRRTDKDRKPMRSHPTPYTPLQSLLNPLRNIFGGGGGRRREDMVPSRRREPQDIPAPLAPPQDFPDFEDSPTINELTSGRRRRRKRPRRPLVDKSPKYRGSVSDLEDQQAYREFLQRRPGFLEGGRRKEDGRPRRPLFRKKPRRGYRDQLYSPSENEDTVMEEEDGPLVSYAPASNLGLGVFNPKAIVSESGFTPVMPSSGNAPSLAFSIFDDDYGDVAGVQSGNTMMNRMDSFYGMETTGDRGNVVVDIPGRDILPYVPSQPVERSLQVQGQARPGGSETNTDPWENLIKRNTGSSIESMQDIKETATLKTTRQRSADFHSFRTVAGQKDNLNVRQVHDIQLGPDLLESNSPLLLSVGSSLSYGPQQPSRVGSSVAVGSVGKADFIHRQMLTTPDGTSLAYGNMADYGKQHPSFVQQDVHTRVGNSATKQLDTSEDVVYGKVVSYKEHNGLELILILQMSEKPSAPLEHLEDIDSRLLEKLALLEEKEGRAGAEAVVSDLWSIMKQNEG